ncbi:MAG TPA: class I SAM-dependent methyltransferase [Candidatus Lustribacter sp.]|nr:class I SAM-dependent methyltransferase [Candidatus Lustribacter sp.]
MSWKKILIVPNVMRLQRRAPKDVSTRWDEYWAGVRETGSHGDVLWDPDSPVEAQRYLDELRRHSDLDLPVVDVGCGNGRITRMLAATFPSAVGVDLAPHAISRAEEESRGISNLTFRALDMTAPAAGRQLAAELGEVNVLVRGVFHILDRSQRLAMAANLRDLLGRQGTLLLAETNFPGSLLAYLEYLGATSTWLPKPLERAITTGISRPSRFGEAQLAACFPADQWQLLLAETTCIETVPMRGLDGPETLPGFLAVLQTRPREMSESSPAASAPRS